MLDFLSKYKPSPPKRLIEAREAIKQRGGLLVLLRGLVYFLIVYVTGAIVNHYTDGWIIKQLDPAIDQFWILAHQPVGVIALLFVVAICIVLSVAIIMAILDSRPKKSPKPRPLTAEEREPINPLRAVWNRYGADTTCGLHSLFADVVYNMKENKHGIHWANLYHILLERLDAERKAMTSAVAVDSSVRFDAVLDQFKKTYGAYIAVYTHLARNEHYTPNLTEEYAPKITAWKEAHRLYWDELQELQERPEYQDKLAIHQPNLSFSDPVTYRFIQSAQTRPARTTEGQ